MGLLLITAGYAQQMRPSCEKGIEVKYVPRNVFDQLEESNLYSEFFFAYTIKWINTRFITYSCNFAEISSS